MKQEPLFELAITPRGLVFQYPNVPGSKAAGPSKDAARAIEDYADTLRNRVYHALKHEALTADQVAEQLGETPFAVRPRCAELVKMGLVIDSGQRAKNASGHSATIWRAK